MQLSRKSRYGLRALIDLAAVPGEQYTALGSIAKRQEIPPQFLEQVFSAFRRAGLVRGLKGAQGGYRLSRPPKEIRASEIIEALEGTYRLAEEGASPDSRAYAASAALQELLIDPVNESLRQYLQQLTLEDLVQNYEKRKGTRQTMYYI